MGLASLHGLGGLPQGGHLHPQHCQHTRTGDTFDPAHTRGHGGLADDLKQPQAGGVVHMGAAAQLLGEAVFHGNHPHHVAVLLAEQGHGAALAGFLNAHFHHGNRHGLQDLLVDQRLHLQQLLGGEGGEVGKVEPHVLVVDQLAGLLHMGAQHFPQGSLEQVGSGVVAHNGAAAQGVHLGGELVPHVQGAFSQPRRGGGIRPRAWWCPPRHTETPSASSTPVSPTWPPPSP